MSNHVLPFIYSFFLFTGTLISVSSSSFFGMWMGLEMSLMAFIPVIVNTEFNKKSSEAAIKYFLIQAFASAMVIFAAFYFYLYGGSFLSKSSNMFMTLALAMKLGMAPFHFWLPEVLEGLSWINSLILLTWQKVAPLVMMSLMFHNDMLLTLALISAMVGAISGMNQTSLRKILAFSSISHLGWVTATMCFSKLLWFDYFIFYCVTSFILCMSFWLLNLNYFSQLALTPNLSDKFIVFINLLSLGGLPPLLGFLPKFLTMVVVSQSFPALGVLIFSSLITLYFYARLCYSTFTFYKRSAAWNQKSTVLKNFFILSILTSVSILGIFPMNLFNF